ncbi:hypothetical protein SeMB42_g03472 [Synchytrium endobioticum]|uniref:Uncharacterized protein n=1 Tax=Synchytrium endobioticum TaxID=286115 RepID=A0A507D6F4_9FUNG|nr:hypothetical protein SeMB42_g03472 [Synchytrium endobioticum]TPX50285.1 hypothetical protein SeLEV6574_g00981 [Synchytrium endobioticum]
MIQVIVLIVALSSMAMPAPVPQGGCVLNGVTYAVCPTVPPTGSTLAGVQGGAGQSVTAAPGQTVAGFVGAPGQSVTPAPGETVTGVVGAPGVAIPPA